jgi:hypothetical protein
VRTRAMQSRSNSSITSVLGERLVDPQRDVGAGCHLAGHEMVGDQLLGDVAWHP